MEKARLGTESANEGSTERDIAARSTWTDVIDVASRLSHLVQSGRHVSNDQLDEVNQEARRSGGLIKQ
jgi:hypothetical protein